MDGKDDGAPPSKRIKLEDSVKMHSVTVTFLEGFLGLIQQSPAIFGEYFEVLAKIAFLGKQPFSFLLERHVIKHLRSYVLADFKNPDQTTSILQRNVAVFSTFTRMCYTRRFTKNSPTRPPTALCAENFDMPKEDLDSLYEIHFFAFALALPYNLAKLTYFLLHLAYEDAEFSAAITDHMISDHLAEIDIEDYAPLLHPLGRLLDMRDSQRTVRVRKITQAFYEFIEVNTDVPHMTTVGVRFLGRQSQQHAEVAEWMMENLEKWMAPWLIESGSEDTRDFTGQLLEFLCTQRDWRQTIFKNLVSLLIFARNHLQEDMRADDPNSTEPWHLVHYLRLLRELLSKNCKNEQFTQPSQLGNLVDLFVASNTLNLACDENRHELCEIWAHILKNSPDLVDWVAHTNPMKENLLEFYVSVNHSKHSCNYARTALPSYYQILNMCCKYEEFADRLVTQNNFSFAIKFLYLVNFNGLPFPLVADEIYMILQKATARESNRRELLKVVLQCSKPVFAYYRLTQLFELLLQTKSDVAFFYEQKGVEFLLPLFKSEQLLHTTQLDPLFLQFSPAHIFFEKLFDMLFKLLLPSPLAPREPMESYSMGLYLSFHADLADSVLFDFFGKITDKKNCSTSPQDPNNNNNNDSTTNNSTPTTHIPPSHPPTTPTQLATHTPHPSSLIPKAIHMVVITTKLAYKRLLSESQNHHDDPTPQPHPSHSTLQTPKPQNVQAQQMPPPHTQGQELPAQQTQAQEPQAQTQTQTQTQTQQEPQAQELQAHQSQTQTQQIPQVQQPQTQQPQAQQSQAQETQAQEIVQKSPRVSPEDPFFEAFQILIDIECNPEYRHLLLENRAFEYLITSMLNNAENLPNPTEVFLGDFCKEFMPKLSHEKRDKMLEGLNEKIAKFVTQAGIAREGPNFSQILKKAQACCMLLFKIVPERKAKFQELVGMCEKHGKR